jgi:hypothetical protein
MYFYDDIGRVMSTEPSPFNLGHSVKFYDPTFGQGFILMDIISSYGAKLSETGIKMYNPNATVPANTQVNIRAWSGGGELRLGNGASQAGSIPYILANAEEDMSEFELKGAEVTKATGPIIYMYADDVDAMVGIGTTSPSQELHVEGSICYTGSIGACSDARYKTDVNSLDNALDRVSRLRGVSFNWKKDQFPQHKFSEKEQVGLIAQEVKDVVPQVVSEDGDGYYNVDYTKLTPLLIEAIKELKDQNQKLQQRIEKLEGR